METILGECADPAELFLVDQCDDNPLGSIMFKCSLEHRKPASDWRMSGGLEETPSDLADGQKKFFFQKW